MFSFQNKDFHVGILGGGQLGRMLIQSGIDLDVSFKVLEPDANAPCSKLIEKFTVGSLSDYETVLNFGNSCDIITIEIEHVNVEALLTLNNNGKKVFPYPQTIQLIQDKGLQKQFYKENGIPTAPFQLIEGLESLMNQDLTYPFVHKIRKGGYDGRGVNVIKNQDELKNSFTEPSIIEDFIPFEKEIAVIVARNESGEIKTFPAVEMVFHPTANLVEYLFSPAQISEEIAQKASEIATQIAKKLPLVGILAVEMFLTKDQRLLVNEMAPRPHNSGHQTIEGNLTSQYQQHLRAILNLPLGETDIVLPSAMLNLLGEENHQGEALTIGLKDILAIKGVYPHFYGKKTTKPFRKMGHVTIVDENIESLKEKVNFVKRTLKIISNK
jgi:5-(carboxyamino)imidazole ribonucleotide synthase